LALSLGFQLQQPVVEFPQPEQHFANSLLKGNLAGFPSLDYLFDRLDGHWRSSFLVDFANKKRPPQPNKVKDGRLPFTESHQIVLQ
jgi:hypothetical protein